MKNFPPWLLLMLGLVVGYPAARIATTSAEKPETPKAGGTVGGSQVSLESQNCKPKDQQANTPPHPWCEPVRVLREFFGLSLEQEKLGGESLGDVAGKAKDFGYNFHFLVALVPAPPDPRLDQALEAIQKGFVQSEYLLDRVWLPWTGASANQESSAQKAPGILLFRGKNQQDGSRNLEVVFLIGETSKAGIQKDSFQEALGLIATLRRISRELQIPDPKSSDPIGILGPSFSGSAESLRMALQSWRLQQHPLSEQLTFRVATGSATASNLESVLDRRATNADFCRTVLPDDVLHDRALKFLEREMGWDLRRVSLLVESDTAYGRSIFKKEETEQKDGMAAAKRNNHKAPHSSVVMIPFPSHISDLRNALEAEEKAQAASEMETPIQPQHHALALDLSGREQVDLVPTFSSLTNRSNDLMLSNLLEMIGRERIRYVGILATDVKDKLFLAEKVREFSPDVILFTFDNNLLYAHPKYAETMNGVLVFSSYPLFTEGARWLPSSLPDTHLEDANVRQRRQFSGEFQQGVYAAIRYLLGDPHVSPPQAWIAAVGSGSLWPIARLEVVLPPLGGFHLCRAESTGNQLLTPGKGPGMRTGFDGTGDLQILLVAVILYLLAIGLTRSALLEEVMGPPIAIAENSSIDYVTGNRRLLVLGDGLLAAAAGVLLAIASLPLWSQLPAFNTRFLRNPAPVAYLLALALAYALLVRSTARAAHGERVGLRKGSLWAAGGLLAFVLLVLGIRWLWVPGVQIQLFYLRARALSSGLSPLVSLYVVGGAIVFWIWSELKRRRLMIRLASDCPLEVFCDPVISGCAPILESLKSLVVRTLPKRDLPKKTPYWILPVIALLPPVFLLYWTVQPIGETRGYGRLFILLLAVAFFLSALSFYRFFRLWRGTLRILQRLDNASPAVAEAFDSIAKELDWRPLKSFGWRIPPFKTLILSNLKLRELVAAGMVSVADYPQALDTPLKGVFENEQDGGSAKEIENRNELERIFAQACLDLRSQIAEPAVKQFLALRVAAYLRYLFANMRNGLIGALTCGLLALIGVTAYAFQPKHFVSLAGWLALAIAVALTVWVFLQMDRNPTLSRIGGTKPGQVTFDRALLTNVLTYVGIPVLGLVATQFPEVGKVLGRVASQFLRVVGGG